MVHGERNEIGTTAIQHYDRSYLEWQRRISVFNAKTIRFRFESHIKPTDRVVDFGCGPGYLLAAFNCLERLGIEVNPAAREEAARNGVKTVASTDEIEDGWADVIISNSALEHVENPMLELRRLLPKLKHGGRIVFSVPHETLAFPYKPGDVNQHLYTWSQMTLGNLFATAGFQVLSVSLSKFMWPPKYEAVYKLVGKRAFQTVCRLYRSARILLSPLKPVDIHTNLVVVACRSSD